MSGGVPERPRLHVLQAIVPYVMALLAVAAWDADMQGLVEVALFVGLAFQIVVVLRRDEQRAFRFVAVAATLVMCLLAIVLAGPRAAALLVLAGLACLLVGVARAHSAAVRGWAGRALRVRRLRADEPGTAWARDRAALALVLPIFAVAVLLVPVVTWSYPMRILHQEERDDSSLSADSKPEQTRKIPPTARGPVPPKEKPAGGVLGVNRLGAPKADPQMQARFLLEVTPTTPGGRSTGNLGPIYMRAVPIVESGGVWVEDTSRARPYVDGADGRQDGWCDLTPRPAPGDEMLLEVHQDVLEFTTKGDVVVLCPPDTAAVDMPSLRADAGTVVLSQRWGKENSADYRLVARLPARVPFPRSLTRIILPATPVPAPQGAPESLLEAAREVTAGAKSDVGGVQSVVKYLRDNFKYEPLDERFDDKAALDQFVAEKRGTCLQFAEAGAVMLRSLGIAARVGTGFLLTDWEEGAQRGRRSIENYARYVGHAKDCHAWIEVEFQGCGWVIFDPTPAAARQKPEERPAPETLDSDYKPGKGPRPWPRGFEPEEETPGVGDVLLSLRRVLVQLAFWIARHPWPCVAVSVLTIVLAIRSTRRRARRLAGEPVGAASARRPWDRLVADLAHRGYQRRTSQTASEFAAAVVASGGDSFRPLLALTARQQAVRFGGGEMSAADEREIETFRATLP